MPQNFKSTEDRELLIFSSKLEVLQGGATLVVSELPAAQTTVIAGTPVSIDSLRKLHVIKTAKVTDDAPVSSGIPVLKGHSFKVGDYVSVTKDSTTEVFAITSIATASAGFDELVGGTTTSLAENYVVQQSTSEGVLATPYGLTGETISIVASDNHLVSVVFRGTVRENNIPPISASIKTGLPLIRFES